ncbi:hypothetical protein QYM36_020038 [Artemia franciscana]|uniref:Craniofacial development protein 2-like n=1 Tax=Artemia franciscana TaxID=6661 RepID=A0AA88H6C0_ARTSF|nr:hypothetical protein QYM36_020038 [Artemia franciscana]
MKTLDKFRIDIAGLSETRLTGFGTLNSETYHILYSGLETRKEAGIIRARFATFQAKLTVIVVYAPTNDTVDQTKDDFYCVLSNVVAKAHRQDIVTLCGDFNAKVGSDASYAPAILGKHGLGEIIDNEVLLVERTFSSYALTKYEHKNELDVGPDPRLYFSTFTLDFKKLS